MQRNKWLKVDVLKTSTSLGKASLKHDTVCADIDTPKRRTLNHGQHCIL